MPEIRTGELPVPARLERLPDWPERLAAELTVMAGQPFGWGQTDCVHFVARCIRAMTGEDVISRLDLYASEFGALRQIKRFGADLEACCTAKLGPEVPPALARRGDVVMHSGNLGIVVDRDAMFNTPEGIKRLPVSQCAHAWRVG